jgi:hypothetical protein
MNNIVEGMNCAAKKSDMAAKPKDNMDTAIDVMQNHVALKARTRKCDLARSLNAQPLYIQPRYGHNKHVLVKLRQKACHMVIQQFRRKYTILLNLAYYVYFYNSHWLIIIPEKVNYTAVQVSSIHWYIV